MCPKYSRRGYLPRNKPLSNRLRVRKIQSKRKASKRSRPTSPPDHPRDATIHRARRPEPSSALFDARFLSISEVRPSLLRGHSTGLFTHASATPRPGPPVMKSSSGLWRHGVRTRFDCAITTAGGGCRGCRHSCARRRDVPPHRSMDPSRHREIHARSTT